MKYSYSPRLNQIILISLLFVSVTSISFSQENHEQINTDSLTLELEAITKQGHINGLGVAMVNEKGTIYEKGFGFANKQLKIPYTSQSIQNIASISKTFLGIALLKAQEMGKLSLDDPINKYLPFEVHNPYYPEEPITIRQLSTHTSSITDSKYYDQKSYVLHEGEDVGQLEGTKRPENFNPPEAYTSMGVFLKKCLDPEGEWYTKKGFLKEKPGDKFEYSNVAATLAAYVLEMATGEPYDQFSKKYVLDPLQMTSSGWSFQDIKIENHTVMYENVDQALPFYKLITYPDGGLITSVHDLALYLTELIKGYSGSGTILSADSYKELYKQQLSDNQFDERDAESPYNDEYNMGVFMGFSAKGNIGHSGGDPGVTTLMFFNAASKTGQIIFVNTGMEEAGFKEFIDVWMKVESYRNKLVD